MSYLSSNQSIYTCVKRCRSSCTWLVYKLRTARRIDFHICSFPNKVCNKFKIYQLEANKHHPQAIHQTNARQWSGSKVRHHYCSMTLEKLVASLYWKSILRSRVAWAYRNPLEDRMVVEVKCWLMLLACLVFLGAVENRSFWHSLQFTYWMCRVEISSLSKPYTLCNMKWNMCGL